MYKPVDRIEFERIKRLRANGTTTVQLRALFHRGATMVAKIIRSDTYDDFIQGKIANTGESQVVSELRKVREIKAQELETLDTAIKLIVSMTKGGQ